MAEDDSKGFLSRWSQRKVEARRQEGAEPDAAEMQPPPEQEPEAVDLESLPPVEELTETSDFTPYLRKGVPEAMRKAALRKLWVTEPSVVNYVPLVEYAWHNNEPGFGPLLPTDDVEKLLKQIVEGNPFSLPPDPPASAAEQSGSAGPEEAPALQAQDEQPLPEQASEQDEPAVVQAQQPRRHGGALPS